MNHRQDALDALDAIFAPLNRSDAPGLVVGVALKGQPIYRRGFGLASLEHGVANTPATRMRIGSTSKHFCCLAALLLAEDGRLDIDASVRRYLPELPAMSPEPTLRQFMSHTSGLRDYLDLSFIACGMAITPAGAALAAQARQTDVNFAPGEQQVYANGPYQLLSLVIERVAGVPFEQFLKERLFEPLAMHDTVSVPSDFEIHRGMATQHVPQPGGGWRRGLFPTEEVRGEGAIVSCVDDMLRWLAHLRGPQHRVGSESSWAQMLTPARLNNGHLGSYALGLMVERYRGLEVIHHGGTVIGGNCQMITVPAHELDVILLSNGVPVVLADLANQVIEAVLGEDAFSTPAEKTAATDDYRPLLDATYLCAATGMTLAFGDVGGKLGLRINHSPPIPAREDAEAGALSIPFSRIVTGPYRLALRPLAEGEAAPASLQLEVGGTPCTLERLPAQAAPGAGRVLAGRYRVPDLKAEARIEADTDADNEDGALVAHIGSEFGPNRLTLKPLSDTLFTWNFTGQLAALGGVAHLQPDGDLRLHTLRTRHLRFQRIAE